MSGVADFDAVDADGVFVGGVARLAAVEVVHGERGVAGYFVQTLAGLDGLLHHVLVVEDLVACRRHVQEGLDWRCGEVVWAWG